MTATPRQQNYRMPAEWDQHDATWLAWPHNPEDWPGKFQTIPWVYAEIVRLLSRHERVHILVDDAQNQQRAQSILDRAGANGSQVTFHQWPTNPKQDGTYRKLRVELVDDEGQPLRIQDEKHKPLKFDVIARDGYRAKQEVE